MALFIVFGHAQNKYELINQVAEQCKLSVVSTKNYLLEDDISLKLLHVLDQGSNLILHIENRAEEIINNTFTEILKHHFVIYVVLAGKNDGLVNKFRNWPDYFVFDTEFQSSEIISSVLEEILKLTIQFSGKKPFLEDQNSIDMDSMFSMDPEKLLDVISIQGLYHLMLNVLNNRLIATTKLSLKGSIEYLMGLNSIPVKIMPKGLPIYRVRFNKMRLNDPILFEKKSDLWMPPKEITKAGRFNKENEPVLYTSDNILACFNETFNLKNHNEKGYVTVLKSIVKDKIKEGYLSSLDIHEPPNMNIFFNHFVDFYKNQITEQERLIKNFLGDYINSHSLLTPNFSYEVTNLISDSIYKNNQIEALMYPSTKTGYRFNNIVFSEENADKYILPKEVLVLRFSISKLNKVSFKLCKSGIILEDQIIYNSQ